MLNIGVKESPETKAMSEMIGIQATALSLDEILCGLADTYRRCVGFRHFTLSVLEREPKFAARRIWSTHVAAYPIGGTKGKPCDEWSNQVIERQKVFLCNDEADVRRVMPDYETIFKLGCSSVLNLPICLYGEVMGTVNLLHEAHWFSPQRIEIASKLLALAYAPMLLDITHRYALMGAADMKQ